MNERVNKVGYFVITKENQDLRTFDVIGIIVGLLVIGLITQHIVSGEPAGSARMVKIQDEMKAISANILSQSMERPSGSDRRVASADESPTLNPQEGLYGKDPWGNPYQYRMLRNSYGQPVFLLVWSKGPNGLADTEDSELQKPDHQGSYTFQGDDFGFVKALR